MSEANLIARIQQYLKRYGISGLQSPDYRSTGFFAPQWKALANYNYYQLPNDGLIIAVVDTRKPGRGRFCPRGYDIQRGGLGGVIFKARSTR